jgi:hypothetical protein
MVKKFNLSEAAADILNQSVTSKRSGQDAPGRLPTSVAYGTKEVGDIGTQVTKTTDAGPNATKGVPRATAPGATPPVGSQPLAKLKSQPGQEDGDIEQPEGKKGVQKMQKNTGATFQQYEETETDEDLVYEEKEEDGEHEDEKEDKAMMKKILKGKREKMQEDLDAMLQGENLSEEFVAKASTIFEAAVMSRVQEIVEEVEGQLEEQFEATIEEMKEDFATKIDDYLNYMVEEWIKENEIAIETGLRAEIVEDFIGGLRNLFAEHYIDIPEEKVNVVEELASKVEELEARLNEEINRSVDFKKEINEHKKNQAIQTVCEGLTQTQVEKLKSLAESVEFTSEYEFADKLGTLKEAYTPSTAKSATKSALEEGVEVEEDTTTMKKSHDSLVDAVARTISKSVVR